MNVLPDRTNELLNKFIDTNNSSYLIGITDNNKVTYLIELFWTKMLNTWHEFVAKNIQQSCIGKTVSVSIGYDDFEDKTKTFLHKSSYPIKIEMKFVEEGEENNNLGEHYVVSLDIIDDLLYLNNQSFYVRPIETSLRDFRQNFIYAVYYAAEYIWHVYENAHTLGIDDMGYVISNDLAKRLLKIRLKSEYGKKSAEEDLKRLKSEDIHISEWNSGWSFVSDEHPVGDYTIIQTMEGLLKEWHDENNNEFDYNDLEDDIIADLVSDRQMITCIVNGKPLTFIFQETD